MKTPEPIVSPIKSKSPKKYNGNPSDSEDEEIKERNKLKDKYGHRDRFKPDERKIINYLIEKKSPVYGFVGFLHKTPKEVRISEHESPIRQQEKAVDVQETKTFMNRHEVRHMVRAYTLKAKTGETLRLLKIKLLQLSLKIFRAYFAHKVVMKIKHMWMEAAMRGYKKAKQLKKRRQILQEFQNKGSASNFLKMVFKARIKAEQINKHVVENESFEKRKRGFIGKLKRAPVVKRKILPKKKVRHETITAVPTLMKSTTLVAPSPQNMKVMR